MPILAFKDLSNKINKSSEISYVHSPFGLPQSQQTDMGHRYPSRGMVWVASLANWRYAHTKSHQNMTLQHDQHFLLSTETAQASIRAANLKKEDIVLEIGPGKGVLTKELAKYCQKVIAVEIDEKLKPELSIMPKKVEIIFGNILELLPRLRFNKIVANIPYSISEPLLKRMLKLKIDSAVLLVGNSFYELLENPESKWSTVSKLFYSVEKIQDVPRAEFEPKPRTDSVLIKILPRTEPLSAAETLLKHITLQDDKLLKNALVVAFMRSKGFTQNQSREAVEKLKIDAKWLNKRVEHLSNFQFGKVRDVVFSYLDSQ